MRKFLFPLILMLMLLVACGPTLPPKSASGVTQTSTVVKTGADGMTVEQRNVKKRLATDNAPGSIKHLYIQSAYSGQVLIYSTVQGKVTSSGKRLTPTTATGVSYGIPVLIGDTTLYTQEVIQDDGTYGSSIEYIYWYDSKDIYHQQYITGGMLVHVSDQPLAVKNIVLNLEAVNE